MPLVSLLGNRQLKENLTAAIENNRLSHFYLISGPKGSGKKTLARLIAAAALCRGTEKPCLRCPACRKVLENTHPDCITVSDPEHKNVAVKIIRAFREDVFVRPNEADRKVYIFPQEMGIEGQNALLKILEDPPGYGVFLLISENPETLLPTVRSRCVELKMLPLSQPELAGVLRREFPQVPSDALHAAYLRSGGFLGQARSLLSQDGQVLPQTAGFAAGFGQKDTLALLQTLAPMEKWKRDELIGCLNQWLQVLTQSLSCRAGLPALSEQAKQIAAGRSARQIRQAAQAVQKGIDYAHANVSVGAICGWLIRELTDSKNSGFYR